jgi:hypothetical protein
MIMRNAVRLLAALAVAAASISCGDAVRQGSSPVYLVIDSLLGSRGAVSPGTPSSTLNSDVITNVTSPAPCTTDHPCPIVFGDSGQVTMHAPLKDVGTTGALSPTTNNEVTITRYHVEYIRADGRNTQGVDVPYAFDGAVTATIGPGATATIGFVLVRNVAKQESPLVQLVSSTNLISAIGRVTFYGQDRTGNAVSATGEILITFGNFGDF